MQKRTSPAASSTFFAPDRFILRSIQLKITKKCFFKAKRTIVIHGPSYKQGSRRDQGLVGTKKEQFIRKHDKFKKFLALKICWGQGRAQGRYIKVGVKREIFWRQNFFGIFLASRSIFLCSHPDVRVKAGSRRGFFLLNLLSFFLSAVADHFWIRFQ